MSNRIIENYRKYVEENAALFESAEGPKSIIVDDVEYEAYVNTLLEGIENADEMRKLLDREREMLLEESSSLMASPESIAYAVTAFPMVVLTYSSPILTDGCTVYTSNKPIMTVPKLKWIAKIIDETGAVTEVDFPTAMTEVRPGVKTLNITTNYANIFTLLGVNKNEFRISKRNFMVTGIHVTETDSTSATHAHDITVYGGIDARGNFYVEYQITDADGTTGTFILNGDFRAPDGDINWSSVIKEYTGLSTFTFDSIDVKFRIFGIGNGKATVKVEPKNEIIDINMDIEDSFEIENIQEIIQDWKSIYNVDILAQMTDMARLQIDLNRDYDIADLLRAHEADMAAAGLYKTLDFNNLLPIYYENYYDVLKSIIPRILNIKERIAKLTRREANVIMTGTDTASILKSLQDYAVSFDGKKGEFGLSSKGLAEFARMKIIGSNAIDDNKAYILVKGSTPSEATILVSVYKPLYTFEEKTDARLRVFMKSRYSVDLIRADSIGCLELQNIDKIVG